MADRYTLQYANTDRKFMKQELVEIASALDGWKWDERLGPAPIGWDSMPSFSKGFSRKKKWYRKTPKTKAEAMRPLVHELYRYVSTYDSLKYHWLHNLGRTEEEFNEWYLGQLGDMVLEPWRQRI